MDKSHTPASDLHRLTQQMIDTGDTSPEAIEQYLLKAMPVYQEICDQIGLGKWCRNTIRRDPKYLTPRQEISWSLPTCDPSEILLVEAKSGNERKSVHCWVELKSKETVTCKYKTFSVRYKSFDPCKGWQCKSCGAFYYWSEMDFQSDYTTQGNYYGSYFKCFCCFDDFIYNDPEYYDEISEGMFNAVVVCPAEIDWKKIKKQLGLKKGDFRKHRKPRREQTNPAADLNDFPMTYPVGRQVTMLSLLNLNGAEQH